MEVTREYPCLVHTRREMRNSRCNSRFRLTLFVLANGVSAPRVLTASAALLLLHELLAFFGESLVFAHPVAFLAWAPNIIFAHEHIRGQFFRSGNPGDSGCARSGLCPVESAFFAASSVFFVTSTGFRVAVPPRA